VPPSVELLEPTTSPVFKLRPMTPSFQTRLTPLTGQVIVKVLIEFIFCQTLPGRKGHSSSETTSKRAASPQPCTSKQIPQEVSKKPKKSSGIN